MSRVLFALLLAMWLLPGCASTHRGPYEPRTAMTRDTQKADTLNRQAAPLIHESPMRAETLLREALDADLYFGPAHNNLGVVYLHQDKLYEAAGEFEWARRLMPEHAEPRTNLALTLQKAGRFDDAVESYNSALAVNPNHVRSMQGLTRLQLRHDRADEATLEMLEVIAMRGETPQWRDWARAQAARLDR